MQMSAMKACFQIAECSFSSAKITYFLGKFSIEVQKFEGFQAL